MRFGWRSIFTINVPLGIVAFFIVATRLVESRGSSRDPMDLAGTAALAAGITLILFGVLHTPGSAGGGSLALRLALIVAGSCALAAFAALQARRRHPLVPPQLFRHWDSASPYLSAILLGTTIFGVDTFVPLFVQGARGGTAAAAGAVVTPLVLFWALSAAAGGRIVVRFGFRPTARLGAALALVGVAGLVAAALANASVAWVSAACGVIGAGLGPSSIAQVLAIQHVAPESQRGIATSLVPFFRTVGGSVGVGALGGTSSPRGSPCAWATAWRRRAGSSPACTCPSGSGRGRVRDPSHLPAGDRALARAGLRGPARARRLERLRRREISRIAGEARRSYLRRSFRKATVRGHASRGRLEVRSVPVLLRAKEAVARALVDVRLVGLAEPLHLRFRRRDGGGDARVVAAVEADDGRRDFGSCAASGGVP